MILFIKLHLHWEEICEEEKLNSEIVVENYTATKLPQPTIWIQISNTGFIVKSKPAPNLLNRRKS